MDPISSTQGLMEAKQPMAKQSEQGTPEAIGKTAIKSFLGKDGVDPPKLSKTFKKKKSLGKKKVALIRRSNAGQYEEIPSNAGHGSLSKAAEGHQPKRIPDMASEKSKMDDAELDMIASEGQPQEPVDGGGGFVLKTLEGDELKPAYFEKAVKRIMLKKQLNNIYECLSRTIFFPEYTIAIGSNGLLFCLEKTNENTECLNKVVDHICLVINRSLVSNIIIFSDGCGHLITLRVITNIIQKRFSGYVTATADGILKLFAEYYDDNVQTFKKFEMEDEPNYLLKVSRLTLPKSSRIELPEQEIKYAGFLQKLYPQNDPLQQQERADSDQIMPLSLFTVLFKKELNMDRLLRISVYLLNLPDSHMPYMQKVNLLNFLLNFTCHKISGPASMKFRHKKAPQRLEASTTITDPLLKALCEEIEVNLSFAGQAKIVPSPRVCDFEEKLEGLGANQSKHSDYRLWVNQVSRDLKIISSSTFLDVNYFTCIEILKSQKSSEAASFSHALTNFTKKCVLGKEDVLVDKKQISLKYMFFLHICRELILLDDYHSAFAMYCAMESAEIQDAIRGINFKKQFSDSIKTAEFVKTVFCANGNFANLKCRLEQCRKNQIYHIPPLQLVLNRIEHRNNEFEIHLKADEQSAMRMIALQAIEMCEINAVFDSIRLNMETDSYHFNTNIGFYLFK